MKTEPLKSRQRIEGWNHWSPENFKKCPYCHSEDFYEGPSGGMSQNIACAGCGAKFNVMGPFGVDRIGDDRPFPVGCAIIYSEEKVLMASSRMTFGVGRALLGLCRKA